MPPPAAQSRDGSSPYMSRDPSPHTHTQAPLYELDGGDISSYSASGGALPPREPTYQHSKQTMKYQRLSDGEDAPMVAQRPSSRDSPELAYGPNSEKQSLGTHTYSHTDYHSPGQPDDTYHSYMYDNHTATTRGIGGGAGGTSYPNGEGDDENSPALQPEILGHHYSHKNSLTLLRTTLASFTVILAVLAFVFFALVIWGVYSPNRSLTARYKGGTLPAFPSDLASTDNNLLISSSALAIIFSLSITISPCWRSEKRYHQKRFARSELYELIGYLIIIGASVAGIYLTMTEKPNLQTSLYGFSCSRSSVESHRLDVDDEYPETDLFPNVDYAGACNKMEVGLWFLRVVVILAGVAAASFLFNPCLTKKKGPHKRRGDVWNGSCCMGLPIDCSVCLGACFCCCN